MNDEERARLDRLTAAVHYLLAGRQPEPIPCDDDPDDEIRQLTGKVNTLLETVSGGRGAIGGLADGRLDTDIPGGNFLAAPFKQLQSNLRHLTWQTRQIAAGDYGQRVDFMGDFSAAFNAMVQSLDEARSQLVSQVQVAEQLAEVKTRYLNVMAHDIRTPIGAVIGFADILLDSQLDANQRKQVEIIRRNSDGLLSLINNILDFAKLGKKKMELESVPFSPAVLGGDVVEMLRAKCAPGVQLALDLDPGLPATVSGDPNRLRQVLVNLVGNAAKFTSEGSVTLLIGRTDGGAGDLVRIAVSDTGIGIAEDKLEHIFSPFAQAESDTSSTYGGTGLGLSIARELVRLMGGELAVCSRSGEGTTFEFTVALPEGEEAVDAAGGVDRGAVGSRARILVVDDQPDALTAIAHQLNKRPVRFHLCDDPRRALDLLRQARESDDPFTLAWLDISMPGLDGLELARIIRADGEVGGLPLVACTSHIEQTAHTDFPRYFSMVTTKPLSAEAVRRIVELAGRSDYREEEPFDLAGLRVLLVEDNPINRVLIKRMLQKREVVITEATNGAEGVTAATEGEFDLVLMDRMMPEMDGVEAIRRIREIHGAERLPIFALTADESDEGRELLLDAGADGILGKPISFEKLLESLQTILGKKE